MNSRKLRLESLEERTLRGHFALADRSDDLDGEHGRRPGKLELIGHYPFAARGDRPGIGEG